MTDTDTEEFKACSFCGVNEKIASKLLVGPAGLYICDECVRIAHEIVSGNDDDDRKKRQKSIAELKRILRRNAVLYIVAHGILPRILAVKSGRIVDVSDLICDALGTEKPDSYNIGTLSKLLFGSRRALQKVRL